MKKILPHIPFFLVLVVAFSVVFQNYRSDFWYTGWDNLHGEFDLWRYTNQVLGGSWLEHQGLGAPMNLAHLAEVFRLPYLWLLSLFLPDHLIRISFIFLMYVVGGITMYWYLTYGWLSGQARKMRNWLAALGGILYLLHILTLQQFYIAFEMFTVQFAFLPLLFLVIHRFTKPITVTTILYFALTQFLLAPSGHTPTNFYLATLASMVYTFFLVLPKGWFRSIKMTFLVGFLTFILNSYWIIPNLYYTLHNANYVQESHDNKLFAPESVASIKEAGTIGNFLQNKHYLFEWQDYNFKNKTLEPIFNDWQAHLDRLEVKLILTSIGFLTVLGAFLMVKRRSESFSAKWAVLFVYLAAASFIWMGLFPSGYIFDWFYQSGSFREAFRNPFTKLSIIYGFVSVLLFIYTFDVLVQKLKYKKIFGAIWLIAVMAIIYSAWPSFSGHFISEKLRAKYPQQYQDLFTFLRQQDSQLRILPLPQLNHAGWEYFDWQFLGENNGYQGMGFYFFGVPQPVLHRDSDRWVETSDFFYHELKYALDSQEDLFFNQVVGKYQVDLILVDESRVEPGREIDFVRQHELAQKAGYQQIWQRDFLTLYQKMSQGDTSKLFIPTTVSKIDLNPERLIFDPAYLDEGSYIGDQHPGISYPLSSFLAKETSGLLVSSSDSKLANQLPFAVNDVVNISLDDNIQESTPVALGYENGELSISFPKTTIEIGNNTFALPYFVNQKQRISPFSPKVAVIFDNQVLLIEHGERKFATLTTTVDHDLSLSLAPLVKDLPRLADGTIDGKGLNLEFVGRIELIGGDLPIKNHKLTSRELVVSTEFPAIELDLATNPSINCASPLRGEIKTSQKEAGIFYEASGYGVNCNGLELSDAGSWNDYLLTVGGENLAGRGIKFFVNRTAGILADDYLVADGKFDSTFNLHALPTSIEIIPHLNWEIRSFGKKAISRIEKASLSTMPLRQLSSLKISKSESEINDNLKANNRLILTKYLFGIDGLYLVETSCEFSPCILGIDQSFDSAWLAWQIPGNLFDIWHYKRLPHERLNTWANAWQVPIGNVKIVILYWPQLLSSLSLVVVLVLAGLGLVSTYFYHKSRQHQLKSRVKKRLIGKKV